MSRAAWLLLLLLIATNTAWLVAGSVAVGPSPPPQPAPGESAGASSTDTSVPSRRETALLAELAESRERVAGLRRELEGLEKVRKALWPDRSESAERREEPPRIANDAAGGPALKNKAAVIAKRWREAGLDLRDPEARREALETVRWAMERGDRAQTLAALYTFRTLHDVKFDRKPFHALALPLLNSPEPDVRREAAYALHAAGPEPGDLERILAMKDDPGFRESFVEAVAMFSDYDIQGKAAEAVLPFLETDDLQLLKKSIRGIRRSKLAPKLEARLLALARRKDTSYQVVYYCLSARSPLTVPVAEALLDASYIPEATNTAIWALRSSAPKEMRDKLADAFLEHLKGPAGFSARSDLLWGLESYGRERHAAALEKIAAEPGFKEEWRAQYLEAAKEIRRYLH